MSSLAIAQSNVVTHDRLHPFPELSLDRPQNQDSVVIGPRCFEETIGKYLTLVDQVALRDPDKEYSTAGDTLWPEHPAAFTAQVWQEHVNSEKVVYLPHTGQLFTRTDLIAAAALIVYLLQEEDSLALTRPDVPINCPTSS